MTEQKKPDNRALYAETVAEQEKAGVVGAGASHAASQVLGDEPIEEFMRKVLFPIDGGYVMDMDGAKVVTGVKWLLAQQAAPAPGEDGWLQSGGLLYRLTDEHRPCNRDEINVTMVDGSRDPNACALRAGNLLALLAAHTSPVVAADEPVAECERCGAPPKEHDMMHWCDNQSFRLGAGTQLGVSAARPQQAAIGAAPTVVPAGEGEALTDAARLDFMSSHEAWIVWGKDGEVCRVFHRNDNGDSEPIMGWKCPWFDTAREAIDAAILRAATAQSNDTGASK